MHLLRKIAVAATIGSAVGCHDFSAPIARAFPLDKVNGVALPAPRSAIPGDALVVGGSLDLDGAGRATIREQRRDNSGNVIELISTWKYVILGNAIRFEEMERCPANAMCMCALAYCAGPPTGVLSDMEVFLNYSLGQVTVTYEYRRPMPD